MAVLTLLVTANHQGDLAYLPRLYSALVKLKAEGQGETFLIDTGRAWAESSPICAATENRAPYYVLDAMGYHTAFADGLTEERRSALSDTVQVALVPDKEPALVKLHEHSLSILVDPTLTEPAINDTILLLDLPPYGMIRRIELNVEHERLNLHRSELLSVDERTLPDPTIAATVEFVRSEARYYQQKRGVYERD